MNYYLSHNGQQLGTFTLEELRRKRMAKELTGEELIWCPGMAGWQNIDSVLKIPSSRMPVLIVSIVLGVVCIAVVALYAVASNIKHFKKILHEKIEEASDGDVGGGRGSAYALASRPIVWSSNTITSREVKQRGRDFRVRQWLNGYELRSHRDPKSDRLVLGFLTNWLSCNFGGPIDTNLPSLAELSDQISAATDDPLILSLAAVNTIELHEAIRRLERAMHGFEKSSHLAYPRFYTAIVLQSKLIIDHDDRTPVLDAQAVEAFKACLKDGSVTPADEEELADILIMDWGNGFFRRNANALCSALRDEGKKFEWLELVVEGESEINQAWAARGNGYSDSVSEKGWHGFREHLAAAHRCLEKAWQSHPDRVIAADRMIYVSLGESGLREMRLWFDRAVMAQIDYQKAWSDLRWGLRPRWYGDLDSILALGLAALKTERFDTDTPRKFFDVVEDLESELEIPQGTHIYGRPDIWPNFQKMYEGYIAACTQEDKAGWRQTYAVIAYLAKHYDVAAKQLEAVQWNLGHYYGWGTDMSFVPQEVAARTGALGKPVTEAEAARARGDIVAALKSYATLANAEADERTRQFIKDRLAVLQLENAFQKGEWVEFLPNAAFDGWHTSLGKATLLADGALEVSSGPGGHILYSRANIGNAFEVKGEVEVVKSSTTAFQGGIVLGLPEFERYGWYGFRLKRNSDEGDVTAFALNWSKTQLLNRITLNDKTNSFDLHFKNGVVSATINGQTVFNGVNAPKNYYFSTNQVLVGLGAFNDMNDTVMRYRNVKIRKI